MANDTFIVGIYFQYRIVSWPFGRLDVTPEGIGVRSWPAGSRSVAAPRSEIKAISVKKGRAVSTLRIEDADGKFANVVVEMTYNVDRIISQLKNYGYEITGRGR